MRQLLRYNGLHQWDAKVAASRPNQPRRVIGITVFSDTRSEAIDDACNAVTSLGYTHCTVDHIVQIFRVR